MNQLFKALAHPVRRRVLDLLRRGPLASGEIAAQFDMAWPSMSAHLNVLKEAGLVTAERSGTTIRYRLDASVMEEAASFLLGLAGVGPKSEPERAALKDPSSSEGESS